MTQTTENRPAEIFGFPPDNMSPEAQHSRQRHWCPFVNKICNKNSRLIDFPFGVCSVQHRNESKSICPRRFEEQGSIESVSGVLENIALHYFGDFNNVITFSEVRLPNVGAIDYVLVRHKPLKAELEDFVTVEFQTDSTTQTGAVVQALKDYVAGQDIQQQSYRFSMNTYDTIKTWRSLCSL